MASVTVLIGRFKQGSSSAFEELFSRFLPQAARLGDRSCSPGLAFQDGEDIAQCVFWELYRAVRQQRPLAARLCDTPSLLTTLALLTRQQRRRTWRDSTRARRDARRTLHASDPRAATGADALHASLGGGAFAWAHEVQSRETLEQLLALLPEGRYRTVVHLLLQGHSVPEIALELRCSVRTVQRYLVEIKSHWQNHPEGRDALAAHLPPIVAPPDAPPQAGCRPGQHRGQ
jgi:DNA-directed RNA polymerase specialized sigma24 family protein